MLTQIIQNSSLSTVVPASQFMVLALVVLRKSRHSKKPVDEHINNRLLSYKPEPMIDYSKIDTNSNNVLEFAVPD